MRELSRMTCPFCGFDGTIKQLVKHLNKCEHLYDGLLAPPAESLATDQEWFANHPNNWTLRRRITEAERVAYRAHYGLAADAPVTGLVVVLRPSYGRDPRTRYSWRLVRVEGVTGGAEGE